MSAPARSAGLPTVAEAALAWNRTHCCPPLSDEEVVQVVHGVARTHERGDGVS